MARRKHKLTNRLRAVMAHTTRYAFLGSARLAADAGVSKSALSRLMAGKSSPSFEVVQAITAAMERTLRRVVDPRDLIAENGRYPNGFVCNAVGCKGCLPENCYKPDGNRKEEFLHLKPGRWTGNEFTGREVS